VKRRLIGRIKRNTVFRVTYSVITNCSTQSSADCDTLLQDWVFVTHVSLAYNQLRLGVYLFDH